MSEPAGQEWTPEQEGPGQGAPGRHRLRLGQGPLTCQEMTVAFGMDVVPARMETLRVEALRSKAKRLVARGWLAERPRR